MFCVWWVPKVADVWFSPISIWPYSLLLFSEQFADYQSRVSIPFLTTEGQTRIHFYLDQNTRVLHGVSTSVLLSLLCYASTHRSPDLYFYSSSQHKILVWTIYSLDSESQISVYVTLLWDLAMLFLKLFAEIKIFMKYK